jgi:hypothetical protein
VRIAEAGRVDVPGLQRGEPVAGFDQHCSHDTVPLRACCE